MVAGRSGMVSCRVIGRVDAHNGIYWFHLTELYDVVWTVEF